MFSNSSRSIHQPVAPVEFSPAFSIPGSSREVEDSSCERKWYHFGPEAVFSYSLIEILIHYGTIFAANVRGFSFGSFAPTNKYWKHLPLFINFYVFGKKGSLTPNTSLTCMPYDFQLITGDGTIVNYEQTRDQARKELNIPVVGQAICASLRCPLFDACTVLDIESAIRHIIRDVFKCTFYCTHCGGAFGSKQCVRAHSINCIYAERFIKDFPLPVERPFLKKPLEGDIKIDFAPNTWEDRFETWIARVFVYAQMDLANKATLESDFDQIMSSIKTDRLLPTLVRIFELTEKLQVSSDESYFKCKVQDDYYRIFVNDKVQLQIIEVHEKRAVSIHYVKNVANYASSLTRKNCQYPKCSCHGLFHTSCQDEIQEHIVLNNFIICCVACNLGFRFMEDFIGHITPNCHITRRTIKGPKQMSLLAPPPQPFANSSIHFGQSSFHANN